MRNSNSNGNTKRNSKAKQKVLRLRFSTPRTKTGFLGAPRFCALKNAHKNLRSEVVTFLIHFGIGTCFAQECGL
jgi:hypothetical protein